ncbi:aldo/keto reductase [Salinispira pacifica]|uniref:Oxidoreductase of aldo/keto reductase family, subgroup 1 n=1 Tax=Salinispira pacifica TaxID=1307761 RepID=V5WIN8_9SPIO|nr:aldo/keto reductase [Salinispira pacifica]AHC15653.1 oxidoreductase of aldo/keto reductase family, subgroup 1 [Salinispira pacifica]
MNIELNSGHSIPALGLGTFRAKDQEVYKAVLHAIEAGYRHIDTAVAYGNEEEVGKAIAESPVPREELFVTTKVWNTAHSKKDAAEMINESLKKLGLEYIDLVLVHWPWTYERNAAVYEAMEDAVDAGTVRSIGISNFNIHHIESLLKTARITPAVNQMECHVHLQNTRLQEYLDDKGIRLEAYAPFKSHDIGDILDDETLKKIGDAHGKTVPQVSLRWMLQRGIIVIPKSVHAQRIDENFDVFDFELSDEQMHEIRKLKRADRAFPEPDNVDFGFVNL